MPSRPGVYLFKSSSGKILYIGKAKVLKNRLRSYFQGSLAHPRLRALIEKVVDVETVVTDTEVEALILEANLIRLHHPRYNVNLKDDKRYPFLKITVSEPFPRLMVVRRRKPDGDRYFGPYTNVKAMRATLRTLRKIFPIRTCSHPLPSSSPISLCLDYHIKRCLGPCQKKVSQADYGGMIEGMCLFLSGKNTQLHNLLRQQMDQASGRQNFELAARLRDQLFALQAVMKKQQVVSAELVDRDVLAYVGQDHRGCGVILQIREGAIVARQHFYLDLPPNSSPSDVLSTLIRRHYGDATLIPGQIILSHHLEDSELLQLWLGEKRGHRVSLRVPRRGEAAKLLHLARENADHLMRQALAEQRQRKSTASQPVAALQRELGLDKPPRNIQAFDISTIGGQDAVGSLVVFRDGRPSQKEYRRFRIRSVVGQDDVAMMAEVVGRRFRRLLQENRPLPHLVLVDGGKGQLGAARKALEGLGLVDQPVAGLAKRLDEIFLPQREEALFIPKSSPALRLLQRIRDEAHRFAVKYHRQLRSRRLRGSELEAIPGVGPRRARNLLQQFGSLRRLSAASVVQLSSVPGLGVELAKRVYRHLHPSASEGEP